MRTGLALLNKIEDLRRTSQTQLASRRSESGADINLLLRQRRDALQVLRAFQQPIQILSHQVLRYGVGSRDPASLPS